MRQRDVIGNAFKKTEEHHRDSIWITILENPAIKPKVEYQVRKWTNNKGFVDLLITDKKNHYTVIEFKNIPIRYLELMGEENDKAGQLEAMRLDEILELKFKGDKFRSGTIQNWIDEGKCYYSNSGKVPKQLQSYVKGPTVQEEIAGKDFRALAVVIVGSRQILVREMDRDGNWVSEFRLAK
jgi:hypothetical protein